MLHWQEKRAVNRGENGVSSGWYITNALMWYTPRFSVLSRSAAVQLVTALQARGILGPCFHKLRTFFDVGSATGGGVPRCLSDAPCSCLTYVVMAMGFMHDSGIRFTLILLNGAPRYVVLPFLWFLCLDIFFTF
jgi:hypothetical protein